MPGSQNVPSALAPGALPTAQAPATGAAPGFTYKRLRTLNPEYAKRAKWWTVLDLLYKGGDDLQQAIKELLPRLLDENDARYDERVQSAGYINYLAQVVDYFSGALFKQSLAVTPPTDDKNKATAGGAPDAPELYKDFERDCDTKQTALVDLLRSVVTNALIKRYSWIALDLPPAPAVAPTSLADEEASGQLRPYAFEVECEQVLDWKDDDKGSLDWAIIHRVTNDREKPENDRDTIVEEFTVWRRETSGKPITSQDGDVHEPPTTSVRWERYRIAYTEKQKPKDDDVIPRVASGETSFKRIPLLRFELKHGMWIGNLIGGLVKEHFQRRSALVSNGNRSLVTIPYVKLGAQAGGFHEPIPADVAEDQSRGDDPVRQFKRKGFMVLAEKDAIGFAAPDAGPYEFTSKDLTTLKDEIFRVVRQMAASAQNNPSVLGRSGESKKQDKASEAIILDTLGSLVRKAAVTLFKMISEALDDKKVLWTAHGLEAFDVTDRAETLEEALSVDLVNIPSKTFKGMYKQKLAFALLDDIDPQTKEQIRNEITDGVDADGEIDDLKRDAQKEAIENPPPPPPKPDEGVPPPQGEQPTQAKQPPVPPGKQKGK